MVQATTPMEDTCKPRLIMLSLLANWGAMKNAPITTTRNTRNIPDWARICLSFKPDLLWAEPGEKGRFASVASLVGIEPAIFRPSHITKNTVA